MKKNAFLAQYSKYPERLAGFTGENCFQVEFLCSSGEHRKLGINMGGADVGEDSDDFISAETYAAMLHDLPEAELHNFQKSGREYATISAFANDELARRHKSKSPKSASGAKRAVVKGCVPASALLKKREDQRLAR